MDVWPPCGSVRANADIRYRMGWNRLFRRPLELGCRTFLRLFPARRQAAEHRLHIGRRLSAERLHEIQPTRQLLCMGFHSRTEVVRAYQDGSFPRLVYRRTLRTERRCTMSRLIGKWWIAFYSYGCSRRATIKSFASTMVTWSASISVSTGRRLPCLAAHDGGTVFPYGWKFLHQPRVAISNRRKSTCGGG